MVNVMNELLNSVPALSVPCQPPSHPLASASLFDIDLTLDVFFGNFVQDVGSIEFLTRDVEEMFK